MRGFPDNDVMDNMAASLTAGGVENHHFIGLGIHFLSKFDTVIPRTPFYEGMVQKMIFFDFQAVIPCNEEFSNEIMGIPWHWTYGHHFDR